MLSNILTATIALMALGLLIKQAIFFLTEKKDTEDDTYYF